MIRKIFAGLILLILLTAPARAITPEEILASDSGYIKNIVLPGSEVGSLEVDMHMKLPLPMHLLVQVRYTQPDKFALNVFTGDDFTPIMIIRGAKAMINDPLQNRLSLVASAGVAFDLSPQGDQFNANFAFNIPVEGKINNRVNLDFISLFARLENNLVATSSAQGMWQLSGASAQNSSCRAIFSASSTLPLQSLEISTAENPDPVLIFSKIMADRQIATDAFSFPLSELRQSGVEFVEIAPDGMIDTMMVVASVMKAIFTRAALANVAFRSEIEKQLQIKPDWHKIQNDDKVRAEKLKQVFKPFH